MINRFSLEHRVKNIMQIKHIERDTVDGHRQVLIWRDDNNSNTQSIYQQVI